MPRTGLLRHEHEVRVTDGAGGDAGGGDGGGDGDDGDDGDGSDDGDGGHIAGPSQEILGAKWDRT